MVTCSCVGVRHLFRAARECLSKSLHSVDVSGDTYIYIVEREDTTFQRLQQKQYSVQMNDFMNNDHILFFMHMYKQYYMHEHIDCTVKGT